MTTCPYCIREKDGRTSRPKFHILFLIDNVCNAQEYKDMKNKILEVFPFLDERVMDSTMLKIFPFIAV